MKSITIDACVWIRLIDQYKSDRQKQKAMSSQKLIDLCRETGVTLYYSSRLWNYDVVAMSCASDHERLRELLNHYSAIEDPAGFRLGDLDDPVIGKRGSLFGGIDTLSGADCDSGKLEAFRSVFGKDPIELHRSNTGKNLPNWIGDYDAVKNHYLNNRNIFVTIDENLPCFSSEKRKEAAEKLSLVICSPEEAIAFISSASRAAPDRVLTTASD